MESYKQAIQDVEVRVDAIQRNGVMQVRRNLPTYSQYRNHFVDERMQTDQPFRGLHELMKRTDTEGKNALCYHPKIGQTNDSVKGARTWKEK